jgi:hypothetical protein
LDASEYRNLAPDVHAGLKRKLRSRLNRLRSMTVAELTHRALRALQAGAERGGLLGRLEAPAPDLSASFKPWLRGDIAVDVAPYVAAAERLSEGWLDVFALRGVDLGQPPRWNRDPKTGIEAPLVHGKSLDCSDPDVVGDITYLWQLNRHHHLVTLAQAYALTGKRKYFATLAEHLESWFVACPYGMGPNWASAPEAAIRLVNWAIAWQLLGPAILHEQHLELRARWLRSVYQHAEFVRRWLSLHSSASALIGEAAGLFIAGLTWPHWPKSATWATTGKAILEREALARNAADGVNRAQSVSCHQFVLERQLLCLLAGKANGQWFSADYESRLEAMLDYLASIMDAGGNVPQLGDACDGYVTRLSVEEGCPYRSLLATGAILFRRGDFKLKAGGLDDKTRWLLGAKADALCRELDAEKTRLPLRQTFAEGGYYVLGCEFDTPNEIRLVADAGPLGESPAAVHGHADALSFTLSVGGHEFLVDPGTYVYHSRERWRQYFRGTSAHNTLSVDGVDQSVQVGSSLWLKKANAGCSLWLSSPQKDSFEGWHDGYTRLGDPVKHRRLIELDKVARRLVIEDTLEMSEDHEVELFFHCHEASALEAAANGFVIRRGERSISLLLPQADQARTVVHRGSVSPIAGWVSRSFDSREPADTIVWAARLTGPVLLRTEIMVSA